MTLAQMNSIENYAHGTAPSEETLHLAVACRFPKTGIIALAFVFGTSRNLMSATEYLVLFEDQQEGLLINVGAPNK